MRVRHLHDESGQLSGLAVSNLLLTRKEACRIAGAIPDASILRKPRLFRDQEQFCEFTIRDEVFIIEEPFGDSSVYYISRKIDSVGSGLDEVAEAFQNYRWWRTPSSVFLAIGPAVILLSIGNQIRLFVDHDACLDSGGKWERAENQCIKP